MDSEVSNPIEALRALADGIESGASWAADPTIVVATIRGVALRLAAPSAGGDAAMLAIKFLVAAGFVTEDKANTALNIAHGFLPGPLEPAQPAREAVGVDEAMVDRALLAFMGSAAKGAWTYQARMEAALTAALTGDPR